MIFTKLGPENEFYIFWPSDLARSRNHLFAACALLFHIRSLDGSTTSITGLMR